MVHYTGSLADGTVFDSSQGEEPLDFTIGSGQILTGFEPGVIGMESGYTKTFRLPSDQAYGPHSPQRVIRVERREMRPDIQLEPG